MEEETLKKPKAPKWWWNTYFMLSFLLALIGILGLLRGGEYIRDPGQPETGALPWLYLLAAGLFLANGIVSHRSAIKNYEETDA